MRRLHILSDFAEYPLLRAGRLERQHGFDFLSHALVQFEGNAGLQSRFRTLEREPALQPKEFFEDEPPVRGSPKSVEHPQIAIWGGEVEGANCGPQIDKRSEEHTSEL